MNQYSVAEIIAADEAVPSPELLTEWLVAVGRDQDRESFANLFDYFAPRIKTYMLRLGAENALAEDLMQETMVKIWRKASTYERTRAVPSAWIFRIARNLRIDKLRRQKFHEVELDAEAIGYTDDHNADHIGTGQLDAMQLHTHLESLPDDQMQVVRLAFFEGLSHSEICERLDLPLGTVKSRLRLAFGKLRKAMGEH